MQLNIYIRIKFIAINFPLTARQYLAVDAPSILSFTALQSFLVMSHVNVPLYKKQNLEKPFKPRHRAIQLEFIFNIFYHFSSVPV